MQFTSKIVEFLHSGHPLPPVSFFVAPGERHDCVLGGNCPPISFASVSFRGSHEDQKMERRFSTHFVTNFPS